MRNVLLTMALAASVGMAAHAAPNAKGSLKGDYVEARTASVFAGPCHYNGELTTAGREAEMAWNIREGSWNGVALSGLTALVAVTSEANLKEDAERRSILYIDAKASKAQADALADALKTNYGKALGKVVAVKRAPLTFTRKGDLFRVAAKGVTSLEVEALPNGECCTMAHLVWYEPLVELKGRKVGYTKTSGIQDKTLGPAWTHDGQNTAFYGTFSL
jgi:hypothetical protein